MRRAWRRRSRARRPWSTRSATMSSAAGDLRGDPWPGRPARRARFGEGGGRTPGPHLGHRCRRWLPISLRPSPGRRRAPGHGSLPGGHHPAPERHVRARGRVLQSAGRVGARDADPAAVRHRRGEAATGVRGRRRRSGRASAGDRGCEGQDLRAGRAQNLHATRRSCSCFCGSLVADGCSCRFPTSPGNSWPP